MEWPLYIRDWKVQKSLSGKLSPKWIEFSKVYCKIMYLAEFGSWSSVLLLKNSE